MGYLKHTFEEHMVKCEECEHRKRCSSPIPSCKKCDNYDSCMRMCCRAIKDTLECRFKPRNEVE